MRCGSGWPTRSRPAAGAHPAGDGRAGASCATAPCAGVELPRDGEVLEADEVVVNAPVWDMPALFDDGALPWDFSQRVQDAGRQPQQGLLVRLLDRRRGAGDRDAPSARWPRSSPRPRTGLPGFTLNFTGYDPGVSPPGEYLTCFGAAFDATEHYGDRGCYDRKFADLWLDIEEMLPAARGALWKKPHLVTTYGVICKPGLVGAARPDALVRGVEGST